MCPSFSHWPPPLAWDDDTIDDPNELPDCGTRRRLSFDEQYLELRDLGYSDSDIAHRLGIKPKSLERQLFRYGLKVVA